ncbi:hypothetical protein E2C01_018752 [Portunus trituberculatus]|uniref:Uncharacterized protein n=1 Tax=Portunus trituberculatus TaxID=210409 RepID=A0A5B7DVH3_PORTR|nr:hypothetical protein [Portunus trituberculatus]
MVTSSGDLPLPPYPSPSSSNLSIISLHLQLQIGGVDWLQLRNIQILYSDGRLRGLFLLALRLRVIRHRTCFIFHWGHRAKDLLKRQQTLTG